MKLLILFSVILVFAIIVIIDRPKLKAMDNKKKYKAVYYSLIFLGLMCGILDVFNLIPDYNVAMAKLYQDIFGAK